MSEEDTIQNLREKLLELSNKLNQERQEHKELYMKMKSDMMQYEVNKNNNVPDFNVMSDIDFKIYRLEAENKRLTSENLQLKSMMKMI